MRALVAAFAGLALVCGASAHAQTTAVSVNLDRDARAERVERVLGACPAGPNATPPCGFIRIVDGGASAQITPIDQRPRLDYGRP